MENQDKTLSISTSNDILSIIGSIDSSPADLNIFYFSGHGSIYNSDSCIVFISKETHEVKAMPLKDIIKAMDALPGKSLVIIDACYSGSMSPGTGSGETFQRISGSDSGYDQFAGISIPKAVSDAFLSFAEKEDYRNTYIIAACTLAQTFYDGEENSIMTGALLDWLRTPRSEYTFCGMYNHIRDYLSAIEVYDAYKNLTTYYAMQTVQPTRTATDLVLFRP